MKRTTILYVVLALGWLTACSESEPLSAPTYTVGAEDNPIRLQAGIGSLPSPASTRALANHTALKENTAITLRVDGKWKKSDASETSIIQYTTATAGTPSGEYNALSFNPTLYWDDYGTADPNNTENRNSGLNIYGVAVDGESSAPASASSIWDAFPWEVKTDGTDVLKKDLLVGQLNLNFNSRTTGNCIDLKHVLSKITINLTAGAGFVNGQFDKSPTVTLTGKDGSGSGTDYALTSGTVNLLDGTVSSTASPTPSVPMQVNVAADKKTATATALLFPNSMFAQNDGDIVAKVEADGNIYYIKAKELRAAIGNHDNHKVDETTVYRTLSGFHYVISVKVNKTKIDVTASIQDWEKIESAVVEPVVNVHAATGDNSNTMKGSMFDLYYSIKTGENFSFNSTDKRTVNKEGSNVWNIAGNPIYWPTHTTHYFFRGITALTAANTSASVTLEGMASGNPYVTVTSGSFDQYNSPSNLLMGKPETGDANCGSTDHIPVNMEDEGICARTTPIGLTFKYMMAQVEVVLSTEETSSKKVHLDANTKVEITNCYKEGKIYLGSMEAEGTGSRDLFELNAGSDDKQRLSVILPQDLTYTEDSETKNLQFKVTVYKEGAVNFNNDDIDDIYYADIAPIKKQGSDDKVAPHGKWESGVHYVYHLKVLKSGVEVVAKLDDWVTASSGDEEVWL